MDKLIQISNDLCAEVMHLFPFFITNELLENDDIIGIISTLQVEVNGEFKCKYSNKLLFVDRYQHIHELHSSSIINNYSIQKSKNLEQNYLRLMGFKQSMTNDNYQNILSRYIQLVLAFDFALGALISTFNESTIISSFNPISLFKQQKWIFKNHLIDIKNLSEIDGKSVNFDKTIDELILHYLGIPNLRAGLKKTDINFNNYNNESSNKLNKNKESPKTVRPLRDFLKHDKKIEIEKIVKEHFSDLRGKGLRFLIQYFVEKKILTLEDKKGLRESFIQLFDGADVAHFNSIFAAKVFDKSDAFYTEKIIVFDELFNTVFQQSEQNHH